MRCLLIASLTIATLPLAAVGLAEAPAGYRLVWADEFDNDGAPSDMHWRYERGFVRNDELQYYQPENARCEDGLLVIEGRREQANNARYEPDSRDWRRNREVAEYTSASLNTRGKFEWQYGLLEVRAKIDARPGLWPAIWTLGVEGGWPRNGEVDVMEYYDDGILANACWARPRRRNPIWDSSTRPLEQFGDNWADEFHVWRMWWDEQSIRLEVDDTLLNTIDLERVARDVGPGRHPFRQPHYLLLNLAIGGNRGGDPSQTEFPSRYSIDYARVYQQAEADDEGS